MADDGIRIDGKLIKDMTNEELTQALKMLEDELPRVDMQFQQAWQATCNVRSGLNTVIYEQQRRASGSRLQIVTGHGPRQVS